MTAKSFFQFHDQPEPSKVLFVIRGVPGSGISCLAQAAADEMFSADDLFYAIGEGEYQFDASQLSEAHDQCFRNVLNAMRRGVNRIAVHNHFVKRKDYQKYIKSAKAAGYKAFVVTCESTIGSTRGVPSDKVKAMWQRFERHDFEEERKDARKTSKDQESS